MWLFLAVFALDQLSKWLARAYLPSNAVNVTDFFAFRLHFNPGAAFSVPIPSLFSALVGVLVGGYALTQVLTVQNKLERYAMAFIAAGALGNAVDRLFLRAVTDFIAIGRFPIFNVADIAVNLGLLGLLVAYLREKRTLAP